MSRVRTPVTAFSSGWGAAPVRQVFRNRAASRGRRLLYRPDVPARQSALDASWADAAPEQSLLDATVARRFNTGPSRPAWRDSLAR